ncbi:MAG: serine/threonine protein kinase [Acidobacteriia bacterium]|nr:serine/threonine protein kinase [Terriglobia bacterium]
MNWLNDEMVNHLREVSALPDLSGTPYRILRSLASGGMATVYLAEDAKLSRQVALKIMDVLAPSNEMASRMQTEARIIARLEHPGIVPIHDVGSLPDGRVFYVMKYVHGDDLTKYARKEGSLPERLRVFLKVCEAVAFAHAHGVIHRDLKPANIMVGAFGEVLVMDWGVAKILLTGDEGTQLSGDPYFQGEEGKATADETRLQPPGEIPAVPFVETLSGTVLGTPSYMAPEQALGQTSNHNQSTDVYSLGAILYFLLTHRHPHEGASIGQIRERFLRKQVLRPRDVVSNIPRPLEAVCMKSLATDPLDRYSKVEDLEADIEAYLSDLAVSAYRENVLEKAGRWFNRYRFIVLLLFAYMFVRFLVFFLARR